MSYETDRIQALEKLVCDQAEKFQLAQIEDSAQHSFEVRLLTQERDEKQAALVELIKAAKCMMNAIAMSETCIIRFEAALKVAGVDDGFGVRAQKAAGIDTANAGIERPMKPQKDV